VTQVVWNDAETEHLLFEVPGDVQILALDPDDWTLHTANLTTSFVQGPPKVVVTSPEPGGGVYASPDLTIEITFHKDVAANAAHFDLVGDATGPAAFSYSYDGVTHTATLTPDPVLDADDYTLTVHDGIVDIAAGLSLDGEVTDPADPEALPSGEGLPGGDAVVRFAVGIPGDIDGDGVVGVLDFLLLLGAWGPCPEPCPPSCSADFNGNCEVDVNDFLTLLANWG
jgi:hypothetical protein